MDGLIFLAFLLVVGIPGSIIALLIWVGKLSRRVRELETSISGLKAAATPPRAAPEKRRIPEASGAWGAEPKEPAPDPAPAPETRPETPPAPAAEETPATIWKKPDLPKDVPPPVAAATDSPPQVVVFRAEKFSALAEWLQANWIYVISAVSLALAGIFFVQYGVETGLLTPEVRVYAALVFGLALVIFGEWIRRRWGDNEDSTTAYLPSVFSGAGLVTLFGAVLAALHLYQMVSPGTAFAGLVVVSLTGLVLGWYSGPLLAAIGVIGAFLAPFLVGGESDVPEAFFGYFTLIALLGLGIDAGRRWAWVSVISLIGFYLATPALNLMIDEPEVALLVLTLMPLAVMVIPPLRLFPTHGGAALTDTILPGLKRGWPEFPTRLVAGTMIASTLIVTLTSGSGNAATFWVATTSLSILILALTIWAAKAEALEDLTILPALGLISLPLLDYVDYGTFAGDYYRFLNQPEGTEPPTAHYWLTGLAMALALAAAWRSRTGARWPVAWAVGAAMLPPAMMLAIDWAWFPPQATGPYTWAITAILIACAMTALAMTFAKVDGESRTRTTGFTLAALAMIAYALVIMLSETALTLALAATTLAAAVIDRRFNMKPLTWFVILGTLTTSWRLVLDPGIAFFEVAPLWEILLAFGGATALIVATHVTLAARERARARLVTESAAWSLAAILVTLLIEKLIRLTLPNAPYDLNWKEGLMATVWLVSAAAQLWRSQSGGLMGKVRLGFAGVYTAIAALFLGISLTLHNPIWGSTATPLVHGPVLINTLIPAFLLPALVLIAVAQRFRFLATKNRLTIAAPGVALAIFWAALAIRHAWRGPDLAVPGTTDPELYSYTIAMLIAGALTLYQAIAKRSVHLRRIAMTVIALTVAKVFLVDASGLVGLMRVFSFLALGLSLAGLAALNRWAAAHGRDNSSEE